MLKPNSKNKDAPYKLLYEENEKFIAGVRKTPQAKDEVFRHIASQLHVPLKERRTFHVASEVGLSLLLTGCGIFFTAGLLYEMALSLGFIVIFGLAIASFFAAILLVRHLLYVFKQPQDIVEKTYTEMIKQHNIVAGEVITIRYRFLYYRLEDGKRNYHYATDSKNRDFLGNDGSLKILYLNEDVHVPL